ncbi:MAG TPA: M56 family metallopeptidase [Longimicrobiales bacterium]
MVTSLSSSVFSEFGAAWLPHLAAGAGKGTALLLLAFVAAVVVRRSSAAVRHLVWSAGLLSVLLLPVAMVALPWRWELLPPMAGPRAAGAGLDDGGVAVDVARRPDPALDAAAAEIDGRSTVSMLEGSEDAIDGLGPAGSPVRAEDVGAPAERLAAADAGEPEAAAGAAPTNLAAEGVRLPGAAPWATAVAVLLAVWIVGAVALLARMAVGVALLRRITRRSRPLESPDWTTPLWEAADRLDLPRVPRLLRSEETMLPFACGFLRPSIILPAGADDWSEERRRTVLFHELAHIRRRDLLTHMVGRLACALYWVHPLVWVAARRARAESERACDDLVLGVGTRASVYADHLLQIVSGAVRSRAPAAAIPLAQRREFEGRMLAILEPGVRRGAPGRVQFAAVGAAALALVLTVAVVVPAQGGQAAGGGQELAAAAPLSESAEPPDPRPAPEPPAPPAPVGVPDEPAALPADAPLPVVADTDEVRHRHHAARANGIKRTVEEAIDAARLDIGPSIEHAVDAALKEFQWQSDWQWNGPQPAPMPAPQPMPFIDGFRDLRGALSVKASSSRGWRRERRSPDSATVAALIGVLDDPVVGVRASAVRALGDIEDPMAVEALSKVLREDEDAGVRKMAAWALGEIGDPAAIPALGDALRDDADAEVRRMAAWALGEIEDARAVAALGIGVGDADPEVARMAVWALGEIEAPEAAPHLVTALSNPNAEVRRHAAVALGDLESEAAIDPLAAALADESPGVREASAWALGEIGSARAAAALAAALADASAEVRQKAAWALGEIEVTRAPESLTAALQDSDEDVRRTAAWALGEIADPATASALVAALEDASREVRRSAIHALGEIGGEAARDALIQAMQSGDPEVREIAVRALAHTY